MKKEYFLVFATVILLLTGNYFRGNESTAAKKQSGLVLLQSLKKEFNNTSIRDVAVSYRNGQTLYSLNSYGTISVQKRESNRGSFPKEIFSHVKYPEAIAVDRQDRIYVADSEGNQIVILSRRGEIIKTFYFRNPHSLAVLSNGNIVVASPFNGQFLHLYDNEGRHIQSFGEVKIFDKSNIQQNNFLNRGKVLIDSNDNIYFVFKYAMNPSVQKYTKKGKFVLEFFVSGEAINVQAELGARYLEALRAIDSKRVGGVTIITSASIDPQTGNLWVLMNGTSTAGCIYEYSSNGEKLKEYGLFDDSAGFILDVKHIIANRPSVQVITSHGYYKFHVNYTYSKGPESVSPQTTCGPDLGWGICQSPCNPNNTQDDKNCVIALQTAVNMSNKRITQKDCSESSNHCTLSITICDITTNISTNHNVSLQCESTGGEEGCDEQICINSGGAGCYNGSCYTPLLIDLQGNGFRLTDLNGGISFDRDGSGVTRQTAWTASDSDDAWLVLDRNGNSMIDNGKELFGDSTPQPVSPRPNGFLALAEFDKTVIGGNDDGMIDSRDAIYTSLRLWTDTNHNGISEPGELHSLASRGIESIDLTYKESRRRDSHGNWFRYRAKVNSGDPAHIGRWVYDVWLLAAP